MEIYSLHGKKVHQYVEFEFEVHRIRYWKDNGWGIVEGKICQHEDEKQEFFETISINGVFNRIPLRDELYRVKGTIEEYKDERNVRFKSIEPIVPPYQYIRKVLAKSCGYFMTKDTTDHVLDKYRFKSRYCEILKNSESIEEMIIALMDLKTNTELKIREINNDHTAGLFDDLLLEQCVLVLNKLIEPMRATSLKNICQKKYGLSSYQSMQLVLKYKEDVEDVLVQTPFRLMKDFTNQFSYSVCNSLAMIFGSNSYNDPERITEAISYSISSAEDKGHCYVCEGQLIHDVIDLVSVKVTPKHLVSCHPIRDEDGMKITLFGKQLCISDAEIREIESGHPKTIFIPEATDIEQVISKGIENGIFLRQPGDRIYRYLTHLFESKSAHKIMEMIALNKSAATGVHQEENRLGKNSGIDFEILFPANTLEDKQKSTIEEIIKTPGGIWIVKGSAGTGKSYVAKYLIETFLKMPQENSVRVFRKSSFLLMAPTGRAGKIISDKTGLPASTIHSALQYDPIDDSWGINAENRITEAVVIVDESSMLNIELAYRILDACQRGTKLILLGDSQQLQPVGAGNVFWDLITSKQVPVFTLDVIKRQLEGSDIVKAASAVIRKEKVESKGDNEDMYLIRCATSRDASAKVAASIKRVFEKGGNFDDTVVICPNKEGPTGVNYLNYLIQTKFNGNEMNSSIPAGNCSFIDEVGNSESIEMYFRKGDRVLNYVNYKKAQWLKKVDAQFIPMKNDEQRMGVYNGETGVIEKISTSKSNNTIIVKFDNHYIQYKNNADQYLALGYAITTHKSQGSQWKNVIGVIGHIGSLLNCNNNVYTMITRASDFLVVISINNMLETGIANTMVQLRNTGLIEMLNEKTLL